MLSILQRMIDDRQDSVCDEVLEVIAARHAGYRCAGLSIITNLAAGLSEAPLDHKEVLAAGRNGAARLVRLLTALLEETGG